MHNFTLSVLFLAGVPVWGAIGIAAAAAIVAVIVEFFLSGYLRKKKETKAVGAATSQADKIVGDAKAEADRIVAHGKEESKRALKEALLEAKEQDLRLRKEFENETKEK